MRALFFLSVTVALYVPTCFASDLILGTNFNNRLVWQQRVKTRAILFIKREKGVFYSDPEQQNIKGIIVRDLDNTKASASIIAGGIGHSFCDIFLESERGRRLNYIIEIYC